MKKEAAIVGLVDDRTELIEVWTPADMEAVGATMYIAKFQSRYYLYEKTTALRQVSERGTYTDGIKRDALGVPYSGLIYTRKIGDEKGFKSVEGLKDFYTVHNPLFEAETGCTALAYLVSRENMAYFDKLPDSPMVRNVALNYQRYF